MATTSKKKPDAQPVSYKEAIEELEIIVQEVDDRDVDIDILATKIKRAHELIAFCQSRIDAVRFEVENILDTSTEETF